MAEQDGAPSFDLYLDDSGTRCPFKPSRPTGGGMDWFFKGINDIITDLQNGEQVN